MSFRVGIDFDNTIIDFGMSDRDLAKDPELQAKVLTHGIHAHKAFTGLIEFLSMACTRRYELFIVSSKPETLPVGDGAKPRVWAWHWIEGNRILDFLDRENIFFEDSREAKIARIKKLQCDVFVSNLSEPLEDSGFPPQTTKILFDPRAETATSLLGVRDWSSITMLMRNELVKIGPSMRVGSSRFFKVSNKKGDVTRAFKQYRDPEATPTSSQCLREFTALSFMWSKGERRIPQAIACDPAGLAALYQFVEGRPLAPGEISSQHVWTAVELLGRLAAISQAIPADDSNLGEAPDSRTCLQDYLDAVDRHLAKIRPQPGEARDFVADKVYTMKRRLFDRFKKRAERMKVFFEEKFPRNERMLCCPDFSLDQALVTKDGQLVFREFRSFGWEDPAHLAAAINHSSLEPELKKLFLESFFTELSNKLPGAARVKARFELVSDLVGFERALAVLRAFSPEGLDRLKLENPGQDETKLLAGHLALAKNLMSRYE